MSDTKYNLQFQKLCNSLQLGEIIVEPKSISGGLLHRMYAIETTKEKYAIKALNPQIMLRPTAMPNYINSEQIAKIASNNVPALPAKRFNGTSIHEIDKQYYLVFDWVEGKSLKTNEISIVHCKKIGTILADIHKTDFSELNIENDESHSGQMTDWNYYLEKGKENNAKWVKLMNDVIDDLYSWNEKSNESAKLLASNMVISHRDLDSKNVMWNGDKPVVIDWESANYVNPMKELIETAVYWSEDETGDVNREKFLAFIKAYQNRYGTLHGNWGNALENGFEGKLGWLEYSLKRSLWIECSDEEEQKMGTNEVIETIKLIRHYGEMLPQLEDWLNSGI